MTERIQKAIAMAEMAHAKQLRKGTSIPYFTHVRNVGQILMDHGYPELVVIAGLLHDTLEDTELKKSDIQASFGDEVLGLVMAASETAKIEAGSSEESLTWKNRKQHTIDFLEQTSDEEVLAVTCADKLDNISAIYRDVTVLGDKLWERFNAAKAEQAWYYGSLAKVYAAKAKAQSPALQSMAKAFVEKVSLTFGDDAER